MRVKQEFSRFASEYKRYNIIQQQVAQKLVASISNAPKNILDIGCGSGTIIKTIDWELENFTALDFSASMLEHHPKTDYITCKLADFNDVTTLQQLDINFDRVISASALQWAEDLDRVLHQISQFNAPVSLAIFTCKTFKSIYECADLDPILRCSDEIRTIAKHYFDAKYEIVEYSLKFQTPREMFRYIKKSGVSGGRRVLDFKQTKKLMREYPHDYLEFEVLFIQN